MTQNNRICTSLAGPVVVVVLAAGLFFRFYNLDRKVYWNDEVSTSLRLSGHRASEMIEQIFDGRELTIEDLHRYQRINSDRSWIYTVTSLAAEDPKQSPLYFVMLRLWAGLAGDSIKAIRSFSALLSLLAFPALYWLCRELFGSRRAAWVAVALMAVSPFHVLYAQEARSYSLWTATILLSSAALLRALRRQTRWSWSLYAATVALGFYSHFLFGLVAIAHAAYVFGSHVGNIDSKVRRPQALIAYCCATLVALVAFAPWGLIIARNIFRLFANTTWIAAKVGIFHLLGRWAVSLSAVFVDVSYDFSDPLTHLLRIPVLILAVYAIYFLYRRSTKRVWLLVLALIGTPVLALMLPDLLMGGRSFSSPRFLIPCYLGVEIAVAYLVAARTLAANLSQRKTWQAMSVALILCGLASCAISSQADSWWTKSFISRYYPQAALIINETSRPLLIGESSSRNALISLSYLLDPKVRLRLVADGNQLQVPDNFSDVFLFSPSARARRKLERDGIYRIEAVDTASGLWRLAK